MRRKSAVEFALVALMLFGNPARATLVKGPYLENCGPDRITVSWESDQLTDGRLLYGIGELSNEIEVPEGTGVQSVTLEGLRPDTTYFYRIELFNGSYSPTLTFSTAPAGPEPFRFIVFGDTRTDHPMHTAVAGLIQERAPDFAVNTGDLVEDGDDAEMWQTFFEIEHAIMSRMVVWPVMGNHDHRTDTLYDTLFHVSCSSQTSRYYSFDYSNCHFVVTDSEDDFSPASEQYAWLDADLSAAESNADIEHTFVFYHRPPFSSGWHGSEGLPMEDDLHPLCLRHGVEIVFNGHDHDYERSTVDGILYIVTGGGGAPYPPLLDEDQPPLPDKNPYRQVFFGVFHVVECEVQGPAINCEMIDLTRSVRDTFGINLGEFPSDQHPACPPCETGCVSAGGTGAEIILMLFIGLALLYMRILIRNRD
jgi:predicted phosphodiesterase